MEIFDGHTHFFSREFYELESIPTPGGNSEIILKELSGGGTEISAANIAQYLEHVLAKMDECGVTKAVTYASIPQEMEMVGETALDSGGRLVPYVMVNPVVTASLTRLERLQAKYRFRGMLLCPHMHEYNIDSDEAVWALDFARKNKMAIFLHCGLLRPGVRALFGLDPNPPMDREQPAELVHVARKRSNQIFIVPHIDLDMFEELLGLWELCPNIYVDTGAMYQLTANRNEKPTLADLFAEIKRVFGVERILYGSDSSGFPKEYRNQILDVQIRAMTDAGYSGAERDAVLGENLSRVLGLPSRYAPPS
jgi:predicted TIM-barrel fold metal-dependent hydrolase